jgi:parvulin-like peptidyl-prolyl isomerase
MRYLYYIAGIILLVSALAAYGLMDTEIELSKPAIVVNDRIITQSELEQRIKNKPYYMSRDQFLDSIVTEQLLIQEALRQNIHEEASFRQSVERYYEQSLIKILLDRKLADVEVTVTERELETYQRLSHSRISISKFGFPSVEQALKGPYEHAKTIESNFLDISDDLKFILLYLEKDQISKPVETGMGVLVYRLDKITPLPSSNEIRKTDMNQVTIFILDKKRENLMAEWTRQLKETAKIWREK